MSSRLSVSVRLKCTVEIFVDTWGGSTSFDDLHPQAQREGVQKLSEAIQKHGGRLIGEPTLIMSVYDPHQKQETAK